MADTIILATIRFCGGGGSTSRLPDFNDDFNADFRILLEEIENND